MIGGVMMEEFGLDTILHKRIIDKCMPLYKDGYFHDAAYKSMKQVELAIKEKSGVSKNLRGQKLSSTTLVKTVLGPEKGIKLKIPLADDDLQKDALELFKGAFIYYRNYTAHEDDNTNNVSCIRIMVLASELLDLIGASSISFTEIGGVEGLIKHGIFADESKLTGLLSLLLSEYCPDDTFDGLFEDLAMKGYTDNQFQSVFDLGLIEYIEYNCDDVHDPPSPFDIETIGRFELTPLGQEVLNENQNI
jgi:uncharacterized protein (TIGR02391 family)